jgi:hypothetical protein
MIHTTFESFINESVDNEVNYADTIKKLKQFKKDFKIEINDYIETKIALDDFDYMLNFFKVVKPTIAKMFLNKLRKVDIMFYNKLKPNKKVNESFIEDIGTYVKGATKFIKDKLKDAWNYFDASVEENAEELQKIEDNVVKKYNDLKYSSKNAKISEESLTLLRREIKSNAKKITDKYYTMLQLEIDYLEHIQTIVNSK